MLRRQRDNAHAHIERRPSANPSRRILNDDSSAYRLRRLAWLTLAVVSAAYVAYDQFRNNPEAPVMKWGFVLVTLYMGPVGLLLYVFADKEPAPGSHEQFIRPLWKQGVGSTVHCVAGDATGIILAAAATAVLGFQMWVDVLVEYAAGFLFGLLIFQSLFMRRMMGGSYGENVRRSFLPELLSMNCMMAGMAPVMIFLMMGRDMRAMWPGEPLFWFVMSLGVVAGFAIAYPVNVWLVAKQMKHGLMTVRASDKGHSMGSTSSPGEHGAHHGASHAASSAHGGASSKKGNPGAQRKTAPDEAESVTRPQLVTLTAFTSLMLIAGIFVPAAFVNLRVRAEEVRGAIMPPGMIMTADTLPDAMRDVAAADPRGVSYRATPNERGDRTLAARLENGVKVFELDASVIRWDIRPGTPVTAYAIKRQVPGPRLELTEGDHVRIHSRITSPNRRPCTGTGSSSRIAWMGRDTSLRTRYFRAGATRTNTSCNRLEPTSIIPTRALTASKHSVSMGR